MSAAPLSPAGPDSRAVFRAHELSPGASHPAYRADIDGLRALAVISVVMYHAFPATIRGGFIGVDVFFVISGFLISTILFGNLARDRFSFVDFYVRRTRRIFPALLLVLIATFAFGWFALLSDEFRELGKHLAAGAGFVSNLVFWQESGYFDTAADAKPFLHLWSLGIEEQFYIVWPVLLWGLWRMRWSPLAILPLVALVSFALNLRLTTTDPVAAFYSPYSRCWELALGSLLAYRTIFPTPLFVSSTQRQRDLQSWVGTGLLVAGFAAINATSAFPGLWALLPTVGAILLLAAGPQAWVNRHVLSHRVMVWIGLISFPLYLWHWPILSMVRILAFERPTRTVRIVAIVVAVGLAWITYRFVELPIRERTRSRAIPAALFGAMILLGLIGVACMREDGFDFRSVARSAVIHPGDIGHAPFYAYSARFAPCEPVQIREDAERWNDQVRCLQSRPGPVDLAIIGDSHGEHLFVGLAEALPRVNVAYYIRSSLPVADNPSFARIIPTVAGNSSIKVVVLSAWWSLRLGEAPFGSSSLDRLEKTIKLFNDAGKKVYLADDVPNFSFSPRLCKFDSSYLRVNKCVEDAAFYENQLGRYRDRFNALAKNNPLLSFLDISRYFCDGRTCSMLDVDGTLLFRDSDHLNVAGSQSLGRRIVEDNPALKSISP